MLIDGLWKITAIIIAIFLVVIIPLLHAFEAEDRFVKLNVLDEMDLFLEEISNKGKISQNDYLDFETRLAKLGLSFNIDIKHYKKVFVPIYEDPLNQATFDGKIEEVEELFSFSEIKDCLFPETHPKLSKPYTLNRGDYVVLSLRSETTTKYQSLRKMLFLTEEGPALSLRMARSIKNEAY